ncbi:MAG: antibiotic biosynthesis monooxygenase [Peptostreptococcaceae bacterium]|nr:antibiotic biosynthesis monooxygenase [Peptostreptococcaceae bacterium]
MITKIAKCIVKPEALTEFNEITDNMIEETRKETGNVRYGLYRDAKNKNIFYFLEDWKDKEAFESHLKEEHLKKSITKLKKTLATEMELISLEVEK